MMRIVAGNGERRIGEGEYETTVGHIETVEHVVPDDHRDHGMARLITEHDHAEGSRCPVALHHGLAADECCFGHSVLLVELPWL